MATTFTIDLSKIAIAGTAYATDLTGCTDASVQTALIAALSKAATGRANTEIQNAKAAKKEITKEEAAQTALAYIHRLLSGESAPRSDGRKVLTEEELREAAVNAVYTAGLRKYLVQRNPRGTKEKDYGKRIDALLKTTVGEKSIGDVFDALMYAAADKLIKESGRTDLTAPAVAGKLAENLGVSPAAIEAQVVVLRTAQAGKTAVATVAASAADQLAALGL